MRIKYHRGLRTLTVWEDGETRHIKPEFRGLMGFAVWVCERVGRALQPTQRDIWYPPF